jgi:hypothetical protein
VAVLLGIAGGEVDRARGGDQQAAEHQQGIEERARTEREIIEYGESDVEQRGNGGSGPVQQTRVSKGCLAEGLFRGRIDELGSETRNHADAVLVKKGATERRGPVIEGPRRNGHWAIRE